MSRARLVADIGGTNARFAWVDADGALSPSWATPVADHETFMSALRAFLDQEPGPQAREAAIAAAGPLDQGEIRLTNAPWRIREADVAEALKGARVRLLNDLEAAALALPHLEPADLAPVGPPRPLDPGTRMLVVNVGTGFGAATAIPLGSGRWVACPSESGHMSLSVLSAEERAVVRKLGVEAPVTEDVLSGAGVVALYRALSGDGAGQGDDTAEAIIERFDQDPVSREVVRLVTDWLGRIAGDLVLATAAWGGMCLVGGIVESWRHVADISAFHRAFTAKGKMTPRMLQVPAAMILRGNLALLGLSRVHLGD